MEALGQPAPGDAGMQNFVADQLRRSGDALDRGVDAILGVFAGRPHVFNLGHGILPETPVAHVERMLRRVRG